MGNGQGMTPPPAPPSPQQAGPPLPTPQGDMQQRPPDPAGVRDALSVQGAQDNRPDPGQPTMGPPPVAGLNAVLVDRFSRLQKAVEAHGGMLYLYSGARDHRQQNQLYQDAVSKYGSEREAKKRVAPPGKSDHDPNAGLAFGIGDGAIGADIRGDLAIAHKLAAHFGLEFDKKTPWHMRIAGLK